MAIAEDISSSLLNLRAGSLEVRIAETNIEIDAAQALRYQIFYEEMDAFPSKEQKELKRDIDDYDPYFDHLLVIDHDIKGSFTKKVVGTYRLNRGIKKNKQNFYYTASEFNIENLLSYPGNILELGRSCVSEKHRNGKTMQLLWNFIALYVIKNDIKIMFGCASFPGTDPKVHMQELKYLQSRYLAPLNMRTYALKGKNVDIESARLKIPANTYNFKDFLTAVPPLIKGYIRLGAYVGHGAVIDNVFNTIDVCIVLPTKKVASRYMAHYDRK